MTTAAPALLGAPYTVPPVRAGDWLDDEIDGRLQVGGWTAAPMSWPRRKKTGRPSLILTDELARAVRTESSEAVCYWWNVSATKVWQWRKALGVDRVTDGTRKLLQERTGVPAEAAARGRAAAATPEVRARMAEGKRGKPAHPATAAALRRAASHRKPPGWGVRANARMLGRILPTMHSGEWTAHEDEVLLREYARLTTEALGALLGRTAENVKVRAFRLGVTTPRRAWSAEDDEALMCRYGDLGPGGCAALLNRTIAAVYARAVVLQISAQRPKSKGRRIGGKKAWSEAEDQLMRDRYRLGQVADLAKQLGRTVAAVRVHAYFLGLTKGSK